MHHLSWIDQNGNIDYKRLFLAFFVSLFGLRTLLLWTQNAPSIAYQAFILLLLVLSLIQTVMMIKKMISELMDEIKRLTQVLMPNIKFQFTSIPVKSLIDTSCESISLSIYALSSIRI
jgi:hypothetical protein